MPIPGSILSNQLPLGVSPALGSYPSTAVLRPLTTSRNSAGQITHTFADSTDPAQTGLACRLSPLIQIRPQAQEKFEKDDERDEALSQLNFASYINVPVLTLVKWQVKVDGFIFQIRSVESDGSKLTTRLMVTNTNQYEA